VGERLRGSRELKVVVHRLTLRWKPAHLPKSGEVAAEIDGNVQI
jgi:hypothetical protein